jgi:FKBP-type peptidyl-prolyl cis-trans isomerase
VTRLHFPLVVLLVVAGCTSSPGNTTTNAIPAPADVSAPPADAVRTPSGLASKVLKPGTGTRHPRPSSEVTVHYTGWTTDGKMFDSSVAKGEPATFALDQVIPGWTEGVQMMVEGEKRRFWIPESLAYKGAPGAPQGMLVFDVELIRINN